jgi:cytochrome c5
MTRSKLLVAVVGFMLAMFGPAAAQQRGLPEGPNRDFVSRTCQACHDLAMVIAATGLSREGWDATIEEMVSYGLRVSPEERAKLLEYLATYLGTPK